MNDISDTVFTHSTQSFFTIWEGGDMPVSGDTEVIVIFRELIGDQPKFANGKAENYNWRHAESPDDADIVAYRVQPMPINTLESVIPDHSEILDMNIMNLDALGQIERLSIPVRFD